MRRIIFILSFLCITAQGIAQQNGRFDYQIQRLDDTRYEMQLQLWEPENVQFIRILILEKGQDFKIMEAALNKKGDGNYYLFFENEEYSVALSNINFSFDHSLEGIPNVDALNEPSISVELIDMDFNRLASLQKSID